MNTPFRKRPGGHAPPTLTSRHTPPASPAAPRVLNFTPLPRTLPPEFLAAPARVDDLLRHWGPRAGEIRLELAKYLWLLTEGNRLCNLTADAPPAEQWIRHAEDALACAQIMERLLGTPGPTARILDVGSGGGAPGLIWAILWPFNPVTLLEVTDKKVRFLEHAFRQLSLDNVSIVAERAETAAHDPELREQFDWVTARGLAPLPFLAELTVPFAKWGGKVMAIKGEGIDEEIKASRRAFRVLGVPEPPRREPYGRSDAKACQLIVASKVGMTPSPYPRRVGVAGKIPL